MNEQERERALRGICDRIGALADSLGSTRSSVLAEVCSRYGEQLARPYFEAELLVAAAELDIELSPVMVERVHPLELEHDRAAS